MSDAPEPPRRTFVLKPREFARLNRPPEELAAEPTPLANDILAMQRDLRARERASGRDALGPPPVRRARRRRDYWLMVALLNGLGGAVAGAGWTAGNFVVLVYALAGMLLGTIGLTWVLWVVMDEY